MTRYPNMTASGRESGPQDGGPSESGRQPGRARSSIGFPYFHLEKSIEIVQAVHVVGGDGCEWTQLAAHLGQAPAGGGFRQRMISSRTFGLLNYVKQRVTLTEVGRQCIDQSSAKAGRVRAFLTVPLFSAMFDKLDGQPLPPHQAIEHQMMEIGVAPKQAGRARQAFLRSARDAGFFEISPDRMTKPPIEEVPAKSREPSGGTTDSDSVQGESSLDRPHQLVGALLAQLPPEIEGKFDKGLCLIWLQMMLSSLMLIYKDSREELQEIEVRLRPRDEA